MHAIGGVIKEKDFISMGEGISWGMWFSINWLFFDVNVSNMWMWGNENCDECIVKSAYKSLSSGSVVEDCTSGDLV